MGRVTKRKAKLSQVQAVNIAQALLEAKAVGKRAYQKAGELLDQLVAGGYIGTPIGVPDGRELTVVDLFASKSKLCKPTFFSRYDADVVDSET